MLATGVGLKEDEVAYRAHMADVFAKQAQIYGAWVPADLLLVAALVTLLRTRPAPLEGERGA